MWSKEADGSLYTGWYYSASGSGIVSHRNTLLAAPQIPVRPNYIFVGWSILPNLCSAWIPADHDPSKPYMWDNDTIINGCVQLKGIWAPERNIVYHANDGSGSTIADGTYAEGSRTATKSISELGQSWSAPDSTWAFLGWATTEQAQAGEVLYTPGQTVPLPDSDLNLYARWQAPLLYSVTYDGNGYTGGALTSAQEYLLDATVTIAQGVDKQGYRFEGWKLDGSELVYKQGDTLQMPAENITLIAQWTAIATPPVATGDNTTPFALLAGILAIAGGSAILMIGKRKKRNAGPQSETAE